MVQPGSSCTGDLISTTYAGPNLVGVTVTYNMTASSGTPDEVTIAGSLGDMPPLPCGGTGNYSYTPVTISNLDTDHQVYVIVNFYDLDSQTGAGFHGFVTINGIVPSPVGVPQFPLGILTLLAICMRAILILRRRKGIIRLPARNGIREHEPKSMVLAEAEVK